MPDTHSLERIDQSLAAGKATKKYKKKQKDVTGPKKARPGKGKRDDPKGYHGDNLGGKNSWLQAARKSPSELERKEDKKETDQRKKGRRRTPWL